MQRRFYEAKNIRIGRDLIELAPTEAQLCGGHGLSGVVINAAAGTDIAGLFAAGDVSAVAMQFLTGAFVFGRIAASSAAAYLRAAPAVPWSGCRAQITADIARLQQLCAAGNRCIHYSEYEYKARKTINDYCVSPKSRKSLQLGIARFQELRAQLPELLRVTNAHELWKAVEIGFILDCAEMSALASLTREESRWGSTHLRLDFPQRDDANWLKHIDISRSPLSGDMRAQARKVGGWL